MGQAKTVVILGGGTGGIVAASRLRRKLSPEHRVVLVERDSDYVFQPSYLWLMTGLRNREKISRPFSQLSPKGIERVHGTVERIDPESKTVTVGGKQWDGDYLVIALGADLVPEAVPGLAQAGHNLYTLAGAEALREARLGLRTGHVVVLVGGMPFKCPAAPYEAAMLLEYDFRNRKLCDAIQIDLYTPEPGPMPVAGTEVSSQVRQMVEAKGIGYHPQHAVTQVDAEKHEIHFANGNTAGYDLLAYVPPHRAPQVVVEAGLTGESGWVPVDRGTLETRFPGVYAIGDVSGIMLAIGKPLPKAGVFAHAEADVVANNLVHTITGEGGQTVFDGQGECFIETGDGKAGFGSGNIYTEPAPQIKLRMPSRMLHMGKVAFEKYWLFEWF